MVSPESREPPGAHGGEDEGAEGGGLEPGRAVGREDPAGHAGEDARPVHDARDEPDAALLGPEALGRERREEEQVGRVQPRVAHDDQDRVDRGQARGAEQAARLAGQPVGQ